MIHCHSFSSFVKMSDFESEFEVVEQTTQSISNSSKTKRKFGDDITNTINELTETVQTTKKKRLTKEESRLRYHSIPQSIVDSKIKDLWAKSLIKKVRKHPDLESDCWECQLKPQGSGYCQLQLNGSISYKGFEGYYLIHLFMLKQQGKLPSDEELKRISYPEASNLCHNKKCCNPDHIKFESGQTNKRRNVCPHRINNGVICPFMHEGPSCLIAHYKVNQPTDGRDSTTGKFDGY